MIRQSLACLLAFAFLGLEATAQPAPTKAPDPKLIVMVSIDQFSSDVFQQNRTRFTGGFARLIRDGMVFPNGFQSHAATETCPGHSTLLSGRHPSGTGIIGNNWIDMKTGKSVYCVEDPSMTVPNRPNAPRGPGFMKASTLADWMKAANPASRIFSVSGKDRAAIGMVGRAADGTFWWDDANGFNTYVPAGMTAEARLAPVAKFNKALVAAWTKSPPSWKLKDKTCAALNGSHTYGALTLDQRVPPAAYVRPPADAKKLDGQFYSSFASSPMLDETTLSLAKTLLTEQKLGRGSAPDLLAVSLSGVDRIGHRFGTQGPEMCDQLAHLDAALGGFLAALDKTGIPYALALSADHGSVDASERIGERGMPAIRINPDDIWKAVNDSVRATLNLAADPYRQTGDQGYLAVGRDDPALRAKIETQTVAELKKHPEVFAVFTRADILAAPSSAGVPPDELTMPQRLAESFDPDRSGDIFIAYRPFASIGVPAKPGDAIAGHGSVWNYDRRVPILFWRTGGKHFEQALSIETVDIGPTLAALAKVTPPKVDGRCIDLDSSAASTCPPAN